MNNTEKQLNEFYYYFLIPNIMKKILLISFISFFCLISVFSQGFFKLHWNDEFNGTALDETKWGYQIGTGREIGLNGWGNNEQQFYKKENVKVENGYLIFTAKREKKEDQLEDKPFTSGRINSRGKYFTTYGRIEARISLPAINGMWPAFWMLPEKSPYGGWASSGEIDIMEAKGRLPDQFGGAIHYGGSPNTYSGTGNYTFPNDETIENFHVYAVEWKENEISWYCDGKLVKSLTQWHSARGEYPAPFNVDFYILLNLAVGGNFDRGTMPPDDFVSSEMKIDYVRVYKWDENLKSPEIPK